MQSKISREVIKRSARSGFTLVELLLVVAILGVLAGIVVVNLAGRGDDARIQATRQSIANIATAVNMFEVTNSGLPDSLDQLTRSDGNSAPPLKPNQLNDAWGTPFQYKKVDKFTFEIRSAGPDKVMGTEDDLTN